jgi:tRNA pseudouridine38-40 synthase
VAPLALRVALLVAYDGTAFGGFQSQQNARAVQDVLEDGLERLYGVRLRVRGASRTDAGVHATGQVASFDLGAEALARRLPLERLAPALDPHLPEDVRVLAARPASTAFDPRRAQEKTYRYRVLNRAAPCPLRRHRVWHVAAPLDPMTMATAARALVGRQDFSALAGAGGDTRSRVREIRAIRVAAADDEVTVDITADGFLYHMARTIVGTLVECGLGRRPADAMAALLAGRRREQAGATAPAQGLCLVEVRYAPELEGPWLRSAGAAPARIVDSARPGTLE